MPIFYRDRQIGERRQFNNGRLLGALRAMTLAKPAKCDAAHDDLQPT